MHPMRSAKISSIPCNGLPPVGSCILTFTYSTMYCLGISDELSEITGIDVPDEGEAVQATPRAKVVRIDLRVMAGILEILGVMRAGWTSQQVGRAVAPSHT